MVASVCVVARVVGVCVCCVRCRWMSVLCFGGLVLRCPVVDLNALHVLAVGRWEVGESWLESGVQDLNGVPDGVWVAPKTGVNFVCELVRAIASNCELVRV